MASNKSKRYRRRTGSTAHRYTSADVVKATRIRNSVGAMEVGGAMFAFAIAAALIVLIWMVTGRSIQDQREQVRDVAQRNLAGQASIMAKSVSQELLLVEQSLLVLQQAWNADPSVFDLQKWQAQMPALTDITNDLFIADDKRIIRQDILPQAIGQGIASAYVSWPHGALEKLGETTTKIGTPLGSEQTEPGIDARRFIIYIVRPLQRPSGWLIGASFKTKELARLYSPSWFGINALAASWIRRVAVCRPSSGPRRGALSAISQSPSCLRR